MAQQTAVDWYVIEHRKLLIQLENKKLSLGEYVVKHLDILKQAKQMEREQKKQFWIDGNNTQRCNSTKEINECFKQYYNETYGK